MKILILSPSIFMSHLYDDMIFAPRDLIHTLVDGLCERHHAVIFATAPDNNTKATMFPGDVEYLELLRQNNARIDIDDIEKGNIRTLIKRDYEVDLILRALQYAEQQQVDIIHSYHKDIVHYFQKFVENIPMVYTLHDPVPEPGVLAFHVFKKFSNHKFISISNAQQNSNHLKLNFVGNVYHGIDTIKFSFNASPSDSLLFMGRLVPEKGLHIAIAVSLATQAKLVIGAEFPGQGSESAYFKDKIAPHLDNPLIKKVGMTDGTGKIALYGEAKAFLFPIAWEEPFGMVMIEAMACGTPVVAYNRGSVPEIVKDGVTGFIVDPPEEDHKSQITNHNDQRGSWIIKKRGVEGLVEAVGRIGEIDRKACRKHVEDQFTVEKMVEGYEKVYQKVLDI